jgi:hypothetical protein
MGHGDVGALSRLEVGFDPAGHMVTSEPSLARRRVWHRGTRGDAKAVLCREVGSGATGHVVMPEPSRARRRGLTPWDST